MIKMREDVMKKLHEHKVMYRTFSRIREEFPDKSKHKAAKMLDKAMDQSLETIKEDLDTLRFIEDMISACGLWNTISNLDE